METALPTMNLRPGVDVNLHIFIGMDLHYRHLAGLPAHKTTVPEEPLLSASTSSPAGMDTMAL
jgi:hypothetical protein